MGSSILSNFDNIMSIKFLFACKQENFMYNLNRLKGLFHFCVRLFSNKIHALCLFTSYYFSEFLMSESIICCAFSYALSPRVYIDSRPRPETARHVNITKKCMQEKRGKWKETRLNTLTTVGTFCYILIAPHNFLIRLALTFVA